MANLFENHDRLYHEYLERNPGGTYSKFSVDQQIKMMEAGRPHPSLGRHLTTETDWWEIGVPFYKFLTKIADVQPPMKVADYGCGSLRLGVQFIKNHDPDSYFGLDVVRTFYEIGKEMAGKELLEEKRPRFALIDSAGVTEATAFSPDIIISTACAFHVHPEEQETYISNLKSIANKPGSKVVFDTKLHPALVRYRNAGWARPLQDYVDQMSPMNLIVNHHVKSLNDGGYDMEMVWLVFERGK